MTIKPMPKQPLLNSIAPGAVYEGVSFSAPEGADVEVELTANCGCGGKMVKKGKNEWICDRSHWWNRNKHAHLIAEMKRDA